MIMLFSDEILYRYSITSLSLLFGCSSVHAAIYHHHFQFCSRNTFIALDEGILICSSPSLYKFAGLRLLCYALSRAALECTGIIL